MNYVTRMIRLIRLDISAFEGSSDINALLRHSVINVLMLGLVYGLSAMVLGRNLVAAEASAPAAGFNPLMILMVGISVAFFMHAGAALFIWVFSRGIGGSPHFMPLYINVGIAAITLIPLAPAMAALQAGSRGIALYVFAGCASLYALAAIFISVKSATGLSSLKMGIAGVATLIYISCFLYLWI